jgi:hypothetical protein
MLDIFHSGKMLQWQLLESHQSRTVKIGSLGGAVGGACSSATGTYRLRGCLTRACAHVQEVTTIDHLLSRKARSLSRFAELASFLAYLWKSSTFSNFFQQLIGPHDG